MASQADHGKRGGEKTKTLYGSEHYRKAGAIGGKKSGVVRLGKKRGSYCKGDTSAPESPADTGTQTSLGTRGPGEDDAPAESSAAY